MTEPLAWTNDPLLFDQEPQPVNTWLNANDLITQKRQTAIFLSDSQMLNLYPLMIRRNDFVRVKSSDRVMARFPFLVVEKEIQDNIRDNILLISELARDYFYKSINKSIMKWKEDILKYLERGVLPFPLYRCCHQFDPKLFPLPTTDFVSFTSARGEAFKMPTTLDKELAYLSGMVNGDGHLEKYTLSIVDYSFENIKQLKQRFVNLFAQTGRIQKQTENSPELIITNLWVVRFFSFVTSQPISGKKYAALREPLLFTNESFRSIYWSGVMDADGSYKNGNLNFTSTSQRFAKDFLSFLLSMNIHAKISARSDGTFQVYVPKRFHDIYKNKMISLHPDKKIQLKELDTNQTRVHHSKSFKIFESFNDNSLISGFFNFALLKRIQITGLGQFLRETRGTQTMNVFAKQYGISQGFISPLEKNKSALPIELLEKILSQQNKQLMTFLLINRDKIKFRKMNSPPITLDLKPNNKLQFFASKMHFHKSSIKLPQDKKNLHKQIEDYFNLKVIDNSISNKLLLFYFTTFCNLKESK